MSGSEKKISKQSALIFGKKSNSKASLPQRALGGGNLYLSPSLNALESLQSRRATREVDQESDHKAASAQIESRLGASATQPQIGLDTIQLQPFIVNDHGIGLASVADFEASQGAYLAGPVGRRTVPKKKRVPTRIMALRQAMEVRRHGLTSAIEAPSASCVYDNDGRRTDAQDRCDSSMTHSRPSSSDGTTCPNNAKFMKSNSKIASQLNKNNIRKMAANSSQRTVNFGQQSISTSFAVSPQQNFRKSAMRRGTGSSDQNSIQIARLQNQLNQQSTFTYANGFGNDQLQAQTAVKLQYGSSRMTSDGQSAHKDHISIGSYKRKKSINNLELFTNYNRMNALGGGDSALSNENEAKSAAAAALVQEVMRKRVMKQRQRVAAANSDLSDGYSNVVGMGKRHWHQTMGGEAGFGTNWNSTSSGQAWVGNKQQPTFMTNQTTTNTPGMVSAMGSQSGRSLGGGAKKPGLPDSLKRQLDARLNNQKQQVRFYRGGPNAVGMSFKAKTDGNISQMSDNQGARKQSQPTNNSRGGINLIKSQQNTASGQHRATQRSRLEQSHIIDENSLIEMGYGISLHTNLDAVNDQTKDSQNIKIVSGEQDFLYKSSTSCPDDADKAYMKTSGAAHDINQSISKSIGIRSNYQTNFSTGVNLKTVKHINGDESTEVYQDKHSAHHVNKSDNGEQRQARARRRTSKKRKHNDYARIHSRRDSVGERNGRPLMTDALLMHSTESLKNLTNGHNAFTAATNSVHGQDDMLSSLKQQDKMKKKIQQHMANVDQSQRWTNELGSMTSVEPRKDAHQTINEFNVATTKPALSGNEDKTSVKLAKANQKKKSTFHASGALAKGKSVERIGLGLVHTNIPESPSISVNRPQDKSKTVNNDNTCNLADNIKSLATSQEQHNKSHMANMRQEPLISSSQKQKQLMTHAMQTRKHPQSGFGTKSRSRWPGGVHKSSSSTDLQHYSKQPRVHHQLFAGGTSQAVNGSSSPQGTTPMSRLVAKLDVQQLQGQFLELKTLIRHIVKRQEQPLPYIWSGTPYRYQVVPGNNAALIERVFQRSMRQLYWTSCFNWVNTASSTKLHSTQNKFGRRDTSCLVNEPHFKWSPCSIRADFEKFFSSQARTGQSVPLKTGLSLYQKNNNNNQNQRRQIKSLMLRPRHLLNHFECHKELTRKDELINNLRQQLQYENENIFDYTPITFQVSVPEGKQPQLEHFFKKFIAFFENFERGKEDAQAVHKIERNGNKKPVAGQQNKVGDEIFQRPFPKIQQYLTNLSIKAGPQYRAMLQREGSTRYLMPSCHFVGGNYWILKTTYQNRGIGIHVFKTMKQLNKIIKQFIVNAREEKAGTSYGASHHQQADGNGPHVSQYILNQSILRPNGGMRATSGVEPRSPSCSRPGTQDKTGSAGGSRAPTFMQQAVQVPKNLSFIIQKYIEKPLLIRKRKFDIRVWVLVNQDMEVFFFKEGYLRTSGCEYKLDDCDDPFVHLTNNAVQRNARSYGKYEDGNQLDFDEFQAYIDENYNQKLKDAGRRPIDVRLDLVEDMKFIVSKTLDAVKKKLDPHKRNGCFEIFGYDFMVDADFSVWLIECNTNPCLDESSQLLRRLLPRMIDDALRLTIDRDFPSPLVLWRDQLKGYLANLRLQKGCQTHQMLQHTQKASSHYGGFDGQQDVCNVQSPQHPKGESDGRSRQTADKKNTQPQQVPLAKRLEQAESLLSAIEREIRLSEAPSRFQLMHYSDEENLWQKIMDLRGNSGQACKNLLNLKKRDRIIRSKNCVVAPPIILPASLEGGHRIYMSDYESYNEFKKQQKTAMSQVHL